MTARRKKSAGSKFDFDVLVGVVFGRCWDGGVGDVSLFTGSVLVKT